MIIDAHQHFWTLNTGFYNWLTPEMTVLYRDYQPDDLIPSLKAHGIDGTILVQAAPLLEETKLLLDIAEQHAFVKGVVGWVNMEADHAIRDIETLAIHPLLCGIRPVIQEIEDERWLLNETLTPAFKALIDSELSFDALVLPKHLPYLIQLVEKHPELPIVIDHFAKPDIAKGTINEWQAHMQILAQHPSLHCKLSGLITEAGTNWTDDLLLPYMDTIFECFGPERILWGSDWPVLLMNGTYQSWLSLCQRYVTKNCPDFSNAIFGGNTARFYTVPSMLTL